MSESLKLFQAFRCGLIWELAHFSGLLGMFPEASLSLSAHTVLSTARFLLISSLKHWMFRSFFMLGMLHTQKTSLRLSVLHIFLHKDAV